MLYGFVKILARLSLPLFARKIDIYNRAALQEAGPLVLAVNHPNSFLDAILLGAYMKNPVHFITRGDVFNKAWIRKLLHLFNMIPIYRIRDGKEKLSLNEATFLKSVEVLRNNGVLLIFVEGFCQNQTTLQLPLKKGAPRILQACWQQHIPAKVLPVWLEYSSFNQIGKTIHIRLGKVFEKSICADIGSATCMAQINAVTTSQLQQLSGVVPFVHRQPGSIRKALLYLPAMLGAVLHAPLFFPVAAVTKKISADNVHYDSLLFVFLTFFYPLGLLLGGGALYFFTGIPALFVLFILIMPLLAFCFIHWKK
jgi:1-acyl-sn-glycerol-3-phosphate acyltransferase